MSGAWATAAKEQRFGDFPSRTIAFVYDFDGTLSPDSMQDHTILPHLGIKPSEFWEEVKRQRREHHAVEILTYMRLLAQRMASAQRPVTRSLLAELGKKVPYFPGVEKWFGVWNNYVHDQTHGYLKLKHYVVSAGLKEIIAGTTIAANFSRIYASEYHWEAGVCSWPNRVITDASKPQYIFRINKGLEDLDRNINDHMPDNERPIPFENIVYFGDGDTDVPSMAVTRKYNGHALAVYKDESSVEKCEKLFEAGRIDFYAAADYRKGSPLFNATEAILDRVIYDLRYKAAKHGFDKLRWSSAAAVDNG